MACVVADGAAHYLLTRDLGYRRWFSGHGGGRI
jgi:hypothetical protein